MNTMNALLSLLKKKEDDYSDFEAPANIPDSPALKIRPRRASVTQKQQEDPSELVREREVKPKTTLEKQQEERDWLQSRPDAGRGGSVIEKPGRLKSALQNMLANLGEGARRVQSSGRPVSWNDVAGVAGSGAGGAAVGAASPGLLLKSRHQQAVAENQSEMDQEIANQRKVADIENIRAQAASRADLPKTRQDKLDLAERIRQDRLAIEEDRNQGRISAIDARKEIAQLDREARLAGIDKTVNARAVEGAANRANRVQTANISAAARGGSASSIIERDDAQTDANAYQAQLDKLDEDVKKIPTFLPKRDAAGEILRDAQGHEVPSTTKTPEREKYEKEYADITKKRDEAVKTARKAGHKPVAATSAAPKGTFSISQAVKNGLTPEAAKAKANRAAAAGWTVID